MKTYIFLISILGIILLSCKKDNSDIIPTSIAGTWKMITVKDNSTNVSMTKPSSEKGDVILTFDPVNTTSGSFSGNTPTNVFGPNDYMLGPNNAISMPDMVTTKVMETLWGGEFADNIREAQQYSFEKVEKLNIITKDKTLTFLKQ